MSHLKVPLILNVVIRWR